MDCSRWQPYHTGSSYLVRTRLCQNANVEANRTTPHLSFGQVFSVTDKAFLLVSFDFDHPEAHAHDGGVPQPTSASLHAMEDCAKSAAVMFKTRP